MSVHRRVRASRKIVGMAVGTSATWSLPIPTTKLPHALSDVKIRTVKPSSRPMKLSDGGGLHLRVTPAGGKLWRLAYRHLGKQKELALGAYPEIGLAEARAARDDAKRLLALGKDPGEAKKMAQRTALREATNTFSMVADELLAKMERDGRARATLAKTLWLLDFARPFIGARPISQITAPEVLEVLQRVEKRGRYESARRLRSTIGTVFRFAVATARADNDPTFALRGALTAPRVQHRAAITKADGLGPLLRAIDTFDGQPVTRGQPCSSWPYYSLAQVSCGWRVGLSSIWTGPYGKSPPSGRRRATRTKCLSQNRPSRFSEPSSPLPRSGSAGWSCRESGRFCGR